MSQKALLKEIGTPMVLTNRAIPIPGETVYQDNLGRMHVYPPCYSPTTDETVNPHDHRSQNWVLFVADLPYIPAHDIAGRVLGVGSGEGAAKYQIGDHVFAQARLPADQVLIDFYGLQEFALVDVWFTGKVAETSLTDDEAATILVNVVSLFVALFHPIGLGLPIPDTKTAQESDLSNEAILIVGAGSNCGRAGVEFARMAGFGTIIAHAGSSNKPELMAMGATHFVDRHADDVVDRICAIAGDDLTYAVDVVNFGSMQDLGAAALSNSRRGTLATLLPTEGDLDPMKIGPKHAGFERRMTFGKMAIILEFAPEFWGRIPGWLKEGRISPGQFTVMDGLDANKVNEALDRHRDGGGSKLHIHP